MAQTLDDFIRLLWVAVAPVVFVNSQNHIIDDIPSYFGCQKAQCQIFVLFLKNGHTLRELTSLVFKLVEKCV